MISQDECIMVIVTLDLKLRMLKSSFCDYGNACILVKGAITTTGVEDDAAARQADERNKGVIF